MSPIEIAPAELLSRYMEACDLRQPVNEAVITSALARFQEGFSAPPLPVRFVSSMEEWYGDARAAWAAWDARAAWAAWDARDARDAWDARDARDARAAWDARAARAARDARDAAWELSWVSITAVGAAFAAARGDRDVNGLLRRWLPMLDAFCAGAFALLWTAEAVVVAPIPRAIHVEPGANGTRRLHCADGPAFEWLGRGDFYLHGLQVAEHVILRPETITVREIEQATNTETRRVLIERYGLARYLLDSGAVKIHEDDFGVLLRKEIPGDEPLVMVKVVNSTAEPDGTFRDYFLRVHPELRPILRADGEPGGRLLGDPQEPTARNAVASTWGRRGEQYAPALQT